MTRSSSVFEGPDLNQAHKWYRWLLIMAMLRPAIALPICMRGSRKWPPAVTRRRNGFRSYGNNKTTFGAAGADDFTGPAALTQLHAAEQPLLIPGKESLYERVLAVPGSQLHAEPGGAAGEPVVPFTAFYVYARKSTGETEWLQVGTDRHGGTSGWLRRSGAIDWAQGLTVVLP